MMKTKACKHCGDSFEISNNSQKYCPNCRQDAYKINNKRVRDKNISGFHDSEKTIDNTERTRIYITGSNRLSKEAKSQALIDFTEDKKIQPKIEKIKTFKRKVTCHFNNRDCLLERMEYFDAMIQYINIIL